MLEHNQKTLNEVINYADKGMSCCVDNPCGSGKTQIMAEIIKHYKNKRFLVLTPQSDAPQYYCSRDKVFGNDNVCISTYTQMIIDYKKNLFDPYDCDFYLVDEAHHIGADVTSKVYTALVSKFDPIRIGVTATPQRYEDQGTLETIISQYFDGNSAGNYTTEDLQKKGIFTEPEYVLSMYNIQGEIDKRISLIQESEDLSEIQKEKALNKLDKIKETWSKESTPEEVIRDKVPSYLYKDSCNRILVYTASIQDMKEKRKEIDKIFKTIFKGKKIKSYEYTFESPGSVYDDFMKEDNRYYIKLIYSVDKITETKHIDDLNIVLMLRPSVSNRVIIQQFGRLNSIGNQNKSLIIDMVDNLSNLSSRPVKSTWKDFDKDKYSEKKKDEDNKIIKTHVKPQVKRNLSIFSEVDAIFKSLNLQKFYYDGYYESLYFFAYVYGKNSDELKENMRKYNDIEMAMSKTKSKPMHTPKNDSVWNADYEFSDSQEKWKLCLEYDKIISNFIKNHNIKDQDMIDELRYCAYNVIHKQDDNTSRHKINMVISGKLTSRYRQLCKYKRLITPKIENIDDYSETLYTESSMKEVDRRMLRHCLYKGMNTLLEREKEVLELRFGLIDGHRMTLDEVGEVYGVRRERIRQIEAKALRKMRHLSRSRKLRDFL